MERRRHGEDRASMLDRLHPPRCREALAVTDAVGVVDDRHLGVAAQEEISVQRMGRPGPYGAQGCDQRLTDNLPAEHALPARFAASCRETGSLRAARDRVWRGDLRPRTWGDPKAGRTGRGRGPKPSPISADASHSAACPRLRLCGETDRDFNMFPGSLSLGGASIPAHRCRNVNFAVALGSVCT